MKKTRFKPEPKIVCNISFGGRINVYSEESIAKLARLNINENDFVVVFDTESGERSLGKVIHKRALTQLSKKTNVSENLILKKATWFDKLLDKMRLL